MEIADEFFHEPSNQYYWSESHYLDVIDPDSGIAVHTRIGFYPNQGNANCWIYIYQPASETFYWDRAESIPLSNVHGLTAQTEKWRFSMQPDSPPETWSVTVTGTLFETPVDESSNILSTTGAQTSVDLTMDVRQHSPIFYYSDGAVFSSDTNSDRYEVATTVNGHLKVGENTPISFSGPGERDHSWGTRNWVGDAEWLWISGGFEDGTAYNHLTFWPRDDREQRMINGFFYDGKENHPLTDATVIETPQFSPSTAEAWVDGDITPTMEMDFVWDGGETTIEVEPVVTTPLTWNDPENNQRAVLNRSASTQVRDTNIPGVGFLENNTQLRID